MSRFEMVLVRSLRSTVILAGALLLATGPGLAQKKESKEAAAFRKEVQQVQASIAKARQQLETTLASYNDLVKEGNKKLEQGQKQLVGDIQKSESMVAGIRKQKDPLSKSSEKFFTSWQSGLEKISTDSLKEASEARLKSAQQAYQGMLDNMKAAGDAYDPFIASLKDQATLMAQDLSPETMTMLRQKAAPELNSQAKALFASIDKILSKEQANEKQLNDGMDAESTASPSALSTDSGGL